MGVILHHHTASVEKFNPNHDARGRFASGGGSGMSNGETIQRAKDDLQTRAQGALEAKQRHFGVEYASPTQELQAGMRIDRLQGAADGFMAASQRVGSPSKMKLLLGVKPTKGSFKYRNAYQKGFTDAVNASHKDYGHLEG